MSVCAGNAENLWKLAELFQEVMYALTVELMSAAAETAGFTSRAATTTVTKILTNL